MTYCAPLTREEEQKLAARYRDGDLQAGHRIVEALMPFVWMMAKRLERRCRDIEIEDLVQEGAMHLTRALPNYRGGQGRFLTYVGDSIIAVMMRAIKTQHNIRLPPEALNQPGTRDAASRSLSMTTLSELINEDRDSINELGSREPEPAAEFIRNEEKAVAKHNVKQAMSACLDSRWQEALEARIADEETTMREIGEVMGVSKQRVDQMLKKAMSQLEDYFSTRFSESPSHVLAVAEVT